MLHCRRPHILIIRAPETEAEGVVEQGDDDEELRGPRLKGLVAQVEIICGVLHRYLLDLHLSRLLNDDSLGDGSLLLALENPIGDDQGEQGCEAYRN